MVFKRLAQICFVAMSLTPSFVQAGDKKDMSEIMGRLQTEFQIELSSLKKPLHFKILRGRYDRDNASANLHTGTIYAGRRTGIRKHKDRIAHTLCHELGHLIAGAPKIQTQFGPVGSVEGQADYFTTAKCLRRLWKDEDNEVEVAGIPVPPEIYDLCSSVYTPKAKDWFLCLRAIQSSYQLALDYHGDLHVGGFPDEVATFLITQPQLGRAAPRLSTMTRSAQQEGIIIPKASEPLHPSAQCRLNTLVAGALCNVDPQISFSNQDETIGACLPGTIGARPDCWYTPESGK